MNSSFVRTPIADGVFFSSVRDTKFKTNTVTVNMIVPLSKDRASENAMVSLILSKCCRKYPDIASMSRRLDGLYGAVADGDVKKLGDSQIITLSITSLDDRYALDGEKIGIECADILCDMLLDPVLFEGEFPKDSVDIEKRYLVDTIEAQINDKIVYAVSSLIKNMCADEPFGLSKYGTVEDAERIGQKAVMRAYKYLIERSRIEIIFVGSGDEKPIAELFKKRLGGIKRDPVKDIQVSVGTAPEIPKLVSETMSVNQAKMVLGFRVGAPRDWDTATRVAVALYGSTPFSKLFMNVREKLSLCYYCSASFDRIKRLMLVNCGVEAENFNKAKDEILRQLEDVKNGNFTDEDVKNTVRALKNSFRTTGDSAFSIDSWYLGQIFCNTEFSPEQEADKLDSVTRQQIIDAARSIKLDTIFYLSGKEME